MLDRDRHTLTCMLMEPNLHKRSPIISPLANFNKKNRHTHSWWSREIAEAHYCATFTTVYKFDINLNNNIYLINKNDIVKTSGIENKIKNFHLHPNMSGKLRITHKIYPGLYKDHHYFVNYVHVHGRPLIFNEIII